VLAKAKCNNAKVHGQAFNPARPRKIRPLQPNYWPGPAMLWPAAKGQKPKIRPGPAWSLTAQRQRATFEVTTINANAISFPDKVLFLRENPHNCAWI